VRTAILEYIDLAVAMAGHDDRLASNLRRVVVTRLRNLAVVSHVDPASAEDTVHLQFVYAGIDIYPAMNAFRLDQATDLGVV
jgi:hypothetical protein